MSSSSAWSSPCGAQPCLHPKKDGARSQLSGKATARLACRESKFWVECFGEQRICVQLTEKETVLEISLDEEVKNKLVSTQAKTCGVVHMRAQS